MRWTARDEAELQRALASVERLRVSLAASLNATSLREGNRSRTERRSLIAREEKMIAALLARKAASRRAA